MIFIGRLKFSTLIITLCLMIGLISSCKKTFTPKPRGYHRIDFPVKQYMPFVSNCGFQFEVPVYSSVKLNTESYAEACWYNIELTGYNANIYITYKPLKKDLSVFVEDVRTIVYKHSIKADDIIETPIIQTEQNVFGMLYDIKGNAASSVNFYVTDSMTGFLSGSLYFNTRPNKDSLSPAIDFFREDILHIINSFKWN